MHKPSAVAKLWKLIHACHIRGLFSIAYLPWCGTVTNYPAPEEGELSNENKVSETGK